MCGIVGIVHSNPEARVSEASVRVMSGAEHRAGKRDNSSTIWSLMMLELWWQGREG